MEKITDINVITTAELPAPAAMLAELPRNEAQTAFIHRSREAIHQIIFGDDRRQLVVVGPCSIHDLASGREYARRLKDLSDRVADRLLLVMRVYFEKPRTTVGWKGLIMDPHLDGTYSIPEGLRLARGFLQEMIDLGLPTATELLDPITPQYIADLICWSAIGARTTESQTHRQMASGLSMPLGFKNGTDGNTLVAINAIKAASQPQTFLGINREGHASAVSTRGNPNCHVVLRGGTAGPNYSPSHVAQAAADLKAAGLPPAVMVDCSHANSNKDYRKQADAFRAIIEQVLAGEKALIGAMLESNIHAGQQAFPQPKNELAYGVSITDACIDWATTESLILDAHTALAPHFT